MISTITLERHQVIPIHEDQRDLIEGYRGEKDPILQDLLQKLAPHLPWGERQNAARKLGQLRDHAATQGLVAALKIDPFWMVRCAIIQALELIKDPSAVPVLEEVALMDGFQVVRSYARKAVERLAAC